MEKKTHNVKMRSDEVEALNAQLFGTMARLHNILDKKYRDKYKK